MCAYGAQDAEAWVVTKVSQIVGQPLAEPPTFAPEVECYPHDTAHCKLLQLES